MISTFAAPVAVLLMEGEVPATSTGMAEIVSGNTAVLTTLVTNVWTMITGNPLLAFGVCVSLVSIGIGLFRKLKRSAH